jgi:hypothetical protein
MGRGETWYEVMDLMNLFVIWFIGGSPLFILFLPSVFEHFVLYFCIILTLTNYISHPVSIAPNLLRSNVILLYK